MTSDSPHTAPPAWLVAFNRRLASAVADDSETVARLQRLESRSLAMELAGLDQTLYLRVSDGLLSVRGREVSSPDARLRGSPAAFIAMAAGSPAAGRLHVEGDVAVGQDFQKLLAGLQLDVEALLAERFGDVMGVQLARGVRGVTHFAKVAAQSLLRQSHDYFLHESRDLVAPEEMQEFAEAVDDLRDAADLLEQKLEGSL